MKQITTLAFAALLGMATLQSCADDPVAPSENTKITFTQGAEARFSYVRLDTAAAHRNQPMEEGRDSVSQMTESMSVTLDGKTGVTMKTTHYLAAGDRDTTYLWQDTNGDLYIYNFGLDLVNSPEAQAILGQEVNAGWVPAAKMGASSGTTWEAFNEQITLVNFNMTVTVKDQVTANGKETMTIDGKTFEVKKFTHVVTATSGIGEVARTEIEIYVSTDLGGVVRQVRKVATYTLPFSSPTYAVGADLTMTSYTK